MAKVIKEIAYCDLPPEVRVALSERRRLRAVVAARAPGFEFNVSDVDAWVPGSTLRVAFLGGSDALLADIELVLDEIASVCNLRFQVRGTQGGFLRWTTGDTTYAGEIRVGFDLEGYWSLIGQDSVDLDLTASSEAAGGRPGQRSLNLGGFHMRRPRDWHGTVLHEFLHALGVHHEHQNPIGPCQEDFRWEDDPGYVRTTDATGVYGPDAEGRLPGVYTYLSGAPNWWRRDTVDTNLRADPTATLRFSAFDRHSVMLYRFDELFYTSTTSECRPLGDGQRLSQGDVAALESLYPASSAALDDLFRRKQQLIAHLESDSGFEAIGDSSPHKRWVGRVRASLR